MAGEIRPTCQNAVMSNLPRVSLVGSGPGDPDLLTLRGAARLAAADVVLYDGLSNVALRRHAAAAEWVCVGKHGQSRIWSQREVTDEILRQARAGRRVVRLKGGDPAIFARTSEEVAALRQAGIPYEIVPGITAALAAGSYAGIPVTDRRLASAVALVTGHEEPEKRQTSLDWDALARFPGTLVIYMGVTTAHVWTGALLRGGKDPATPAAIVRRCSLPDQQVVRCRLDEVADRLTPASKMRPPVIVIIGPVTDLADSMSWFEHRPLSGRTVLVTRPEGQADALAEPLRELGAEVMLQPLIEIGPPADMRPLDDAIGRLEMFGTLVFCSRNGVRFFLRRLCELADLRSLGGLRLAAVGSRTAAALGEHGLRADIVPETFDGDALADELRRRADRRPVLIVRASRGREVLPESLRQAGWDVSEAVAYDHVDVAQADPEVLSAAEAGRIDWVLVTSSAIARNLHRLLGHALRSSRLASLSPVTTATLGQLGYQVAAEADPYTMKALVAAVVDAESRRADRPEPIRDPNPHDLNPTE